MYYTIESFPVQSTVYDLPDLLSPNLQVSNDAWRASRHDEITSCEASCGCSVSAVTVYSPYNVPKSRHACTMYDCTVSQAAGMGCGGLRYEEKMGRGRHHCAGIDERGGPQTHGAVPCSAACMRRRARLPTVLYRASPAAGTKCTKGLRKSLSESSGSART